MAVLLAVLLGVAAVMAAAAATRSARRTGRHASVAVLVNPPPSPLPPASSSPTGADADGGAGGDGGGDGAPFEAGYDPPLGDGVALPPAWHGALLVDYPALHARLRAAHAVGDWSAGGALVWACPEVKCAGLGDRLRGLGFAYLLAAATRRALYVTWDEPPLTGVLRGGVIDWVAPPPVAEPLAAAAAAAARRQGRAHKKRERPQPPPPTAVGDPPRLGVLPWWNCHPPLSCGGTPSMPNVSELAGLRPGRRATPAWAADVAAGRVPVTRMDLLTDDLDAATAAAEVIALETRLLPDLSYFALNPHVRASEVFPFEAPTPLSAATRGGAAGAPLPPPPPPLPTATGLGRALTRALFRPTPTLIAAAAPLRASLAAAAAAAGTPPGVYYAVHVRTGLDFGEDLVGRAPTDWPATAAALLSCVDALELAHLGRAAPPLPVNRSGGRNGGGGGSDGDRGLLSRWWWGSPPTPPPRRRAPIFLATDGSAFKEPFATAAAAAGRTVVSAAAKAAHLTHNVGRPGRAAGMAAAFADLLVLGGGTGGLVAGTQSGFVVTADRLFGEGRGVLPAATEECDRRVDMWSRGFKDAVGSLRTAEQIRRRGF
ncbi:hypothetical protein BU14_0403s0018 [Porphyra umbilicalis]|uniref:O-fucosyltransferase family protein n=1 Tax=Porphyra umbilicalis TaxID=2786 RepID=A0A1X6NW48_PORUM|nr:hypothetical protein BU14_0403s0018 [Porphyra umbilicalis]|eukprot:OSX72817.1 hypothetical protein BU14_0403s0018 [Porphyra umbilicalis]